MQPSIRTTMNFSPAFHDKLKRVADDIGKPMGQVIEDYLHPVIDELQTKRRRAVFDGLRELEGMIQEPATDASTTIDEYLYGWGRDETEAGE
ncbi:MAG: hypothetical protein IPK17_30810 [Chloroflexi bacterium]|uniref:hypothetical protein n=1 Tax=Candidatus Flexifilum breve TaxID=3140694 RepID=UPI003135AAC0|nr:hypothetical protein [Chloroflexota bacterium]